MAKNKLMEGIHDVITNSINEQRNANRDWSSEVTGMFSVSGSINRVVECAINNGELMNVLENYRKQIEDGCPEIALVESYIKDLSKYSSIKGVKQEVKALIENVNKNQRTFAALLLFESIQTPQAKSMIRVPLMRYIKTNTGMAELQECIDTLNLIGDPVGDKLNTLLNESVNGYANVNFIDNVIGGDNSNTKKVNRKAVNKIVNDTLTEKENTANEQALAEQEIVDRYTGIESFEEYTLTENFRQAPISVIGSNMNEDAVLAAKLFGQNTKKEEIDINKVYEAVDNYLETKENEAKEAELAESAKLTLAQKINNNGINLDQTIKNLYEKRSVRNNTKLVNILAQYESAINQGAYQERLYETFISTVSNYTYLQPVETELSALSKRISSNQVDIDLTKLMETMLDTTSYYLVPLIEEDVVRYMENKTPQNRVQLINCLTAFHGDPFINQMLDIIELDQSRINTAIKESEQSIINAKDQIKFLKEQAEVSDIYSPVQYIKENESVFAVNGEFFVKKNNTVNKLDRRMATNLNEQFITLAKFMNDPRVIIESDDCITYRDGKSTFYIFEGGVKCGDDFETLASLRNLSEMYMKYNNYDAQLYTNLAYLLEHFNDIAKVDFAKHIELKENNSVNLDLFRLDGQIFINTHNDIVNENVFYRNVNPIQCSKIINEHMGMNVSNLFEDLMPNQKDILTAINEADNTYQESIDKLKDAINKLESAKEGASDDDKKKLDKAIEDTKAQLEDAEAEYKEFQNKADELTTPTETDGEDLDDTDKDESEDNKPADEITDDDMAELTVSITDDVTPGMDATEMDIDFESDEDDDEDAEDPEEAFANSFLNDLPDEEIDEMPVPEDDIDLGLEGETEEDFMEDEELPEPDLADAPTDMFADDEVETETPVIDHTLDGTNNPDIKAISFDENIVTGEVEKSGQVVVVTPMVGPGGKKYLSNKTIAFTIDNDKNVVLGSTDADLSVDMYHAIVDSIKADPNFEVVANQNTPGSDGLGYSTDLIADVDAEDADLLGSDAAFDDFLGGNIQAEEMPDTTPVDSELDADVDSDTDIFDVMGDTDNEVEITDFEVPVTDEEPSEDDVFDDFLNTKTPTYVKDGTVMDFPADNADPSVIKESKIIGVKPETNKSKSFFVNESKDKKTINESAVEEEEIEVAPEDVTPIEDPDVDEVETTTDDELDSLVLFDGLKKYAEKTVSDYNKSIDFDSEDSLMLAYVDENNITDEEGEIIDELPEIPRFSITIVDESEDYLNNGMMVFMINDKVYYRSPAEFNYIIEQCKENGIENEDLYTALTTITSFTVDEDEPVELDYVDVYNEDDILFLIFTIMSTLTGEEFEEVLAKTSDDESNDFDPEDYIIDENVKIRRRTNEAGVIRTKTGLSADFDPERSLQTQEIKYGTELDQKYQDELDLVKKEEEDKNKLNDSQKPNLPNKHKSNLAESKLIDTPNVEPGCKVKYKGHYGRVLNVKPNIDEITIMVGGKTFVVKKEELDAFEHKGVVIDNFGIKDDGYTQDLDSVMMKTEEHHDLNKQGVDSTSYVEFIKENANVKVPVNIIFEGSKMNIAPCQANAQDIIKGRKYIHVINENGIEDLYPAETVQQLPSDDLYVWAVYTIKSDNEPQRKVKVSIPSWQEHMDDEPDALIDVLINDSPAQLPKETLKIIS